MLAEYSAVHATFKSSWQRKKKKKNIVVELKVHGEWYGQRGDYAVYEIMSVCMCVKQQTDNQFIIICNCI